MATARPARHSPARSRSERTEEADSRHSAPLWARAVHHFYDPIFDIRSGPAFQSAIDEFVGLAPAERAFHETHLLYRLVLGMEGVFSVLRRIEQKLDASGPADWSALGHLAPIRAALEEIASHQAELTQMSGLEGDDEQDEDEQDEDELSEASGDEDPDFIYDTVPDDEPLRRRPPRRVPPAEPPRTARAADPGREALVGELVPATEDPNAEAGER